MLLFLQIKLCTSKFLNRCAYSFNEHLIPPPPLSLTPPYFTLHPLTSASRRPPPPHPPSTLSRYCFILSFIYFLSSSFSWLLSLSLSLSPSLSFSLSPSLPLSLSLSLSLSLLSLFPLLPLLIVIHNCKVSIVVERSLRVDVARCYLVSRMQY